MAVVNKSNRISALTIILIVLVLVGLAGSGYMFMQNKKLKDDVKTAQNSNSEDQDQDVINKVSALVVLPDEKPAVAKVEDKDKFNKDKPLMNKAENGDMVLLYSQAKRMIIYRQSENRVVDIIAVSVETDKNGQSDKTTPGTGTTSDKSTDTSAATQEPATDDTN